MAMHKRILSSNEKWELDGNLSVHNDKIVKLEDILKANPNITHKELGQMTGLNDNEIAHIVFRMNNRAIRANNDNLEGNIKFYLPRKIIGFNYKTGELRFETKVIAHFCDVPRAYVTQIAKRENAKILTESENRVRDYLIEHSKDLDYLKDREETARKVSSDLKLYCPLVDYLIFNKGLFHDFQVIEEIVSSTNMDSKRVSQIYFALRNPNYFVNNEPNALKIYRELKFSLDEIGKVMPHVIRIQ